MRRRVRGCVVLAALTAIVNVSGAWVPASRAVSVSQTGSSAGQQPVVWGRTGAWRSVSPASSVNRLGRQRQQQWQQQRQRQQWQRTPPSLSPPSPMTLSVTALPTEVVCTFLPPLLAMLARYDYIVSYGYGGAVALAGWSVFRRTAPTPTFASTVLRLQSAVMVFYGIRLCLFLLVRNIVSKRIQEIQKRIEERSRQRQGQSNSWLASRLKLLPLALSCGGLYYGLIAPLLLLEQWVAVADAGGVVPPLARTALIACWSLSFLGFLVAALGDFVKTNAKRKDQDKLVTTGLYAILRHPNYTGEIVGWTCNFVAGCVAALAAVAGARTTDGVLAAVVVNRRTMTAFLASNFLGWLGIVFVLLQATTGLEKRQKEKYGSSPEYITWIENTWSGWMLPDKESVNGGKLTSSSKHKIEVSDTIEEGGTGI